MRQRLAIPCVLALLAGLTGVLDAQIAIEKAPARPKLGITVEEGTGNGLEVAGVEAGPAARAGLKVGDRIISFGGAPINSISDLTGVLRGLKSGSSAKMELKRGSESIHTVVSFARPKRGGTIVKRGPGAPAATAGGAHAIGRPRGALADAEASIKKAMKLLAGDLSAEEVKKARKLLAKALKSVAKARKERTPEHPRGHGGGAAGVFGDDIGQLIQDMIADGATQEEIEEAIKGKFGGNVRVQFGGTIGEEEEPVEEEEEKSEAGEKKSATSSSSKSSKSSSSSSSSSKKSDGSDAEMKAFLEKMRKKAEADAKKKQEAEAKKGSG